MADKYDNPICQQCIAEHLTKYKDFVDDDGEIYTEFSVPCEGIKQDVLGTKWKDILTKEQQDDALAILDPVEWAKRYAIMTNGKPWVARWYQERLLRCTSERKVTRLGRRCLANDTQIMTPGGPVAIKDIKVNDQVYAYDTKNNSVAVTKVKEVFNQGKQNVVDLINHKHRILACTPDHKWHISTCWGTSRVKELRDFSRDNPITRRFVDVPMGTKQEPHAYAIGALLGDGCSREKGNKIYISSEDASIPEAVANELGSKFKKCISNNNTWVLYHKLGRNNPDNISCNHYDDWCKNRYAHEKTVDLGTIKTWTRESCLKFLAGLLDTDGSVCYSGKEIQVSWGMQAKNVIQAVQYLLLALFQINVTMYKDQRAKYVNGPVWSVSVKNNLFNKRILKTLDQYLAVDRKKWKDEYSALLENNTNPNSYGIRFDLSKTYKADTYDISIDTPDHLFLTAEGLVSHNSGKTDAIAIHIMWQCFTNKHKRVLVIAPYKAQVEEIIGRIRSFLSMNPALGNAVARDVSSPYYEIKFHNGSAIRGFSSGTKSGNEAAAVRGQDADAIYLDEADYLSSNDLGAIIAILNTHPHVTLWASSTPKGSREHFYNWCTGSPTYKEFKYPSSVLPHWDDIKDKFRADYAGRPDDWTHEILAEFGEQSVGVFQNTFIDRALTNFKYDEQTPLPGWIYSIGVDWNKEVGTEIVVTGYNPMAHKFRIVEALNVPKQEFTQVRGMEAVIAMNAKWSPAFVYVDEGAGGTNIELLRKYGYDMIAHNKKDPGCQLATNLKAYNFSAKLEIHDPINGVPIKKDAKPFMVENAVRRFEENTLEISTFDTRLKRQLENYIIDHYTPTGRPVYSQLDKKVGDHRLDALMLALVAYKLEISDFARPNYTTRVAISGGFDSHGKEHGAQKAAETRLNQMPESRYEIDNGSPMDSSDMPAITGEEHQMKTDRPGWDTDEEIKFAVKYRMERIKKRLLRRVFRPTRKNI